MIGVRRLFKEHCGPGARYVWSEVAKRGDYDVVVVQFDIVPEGRRFNLDGLIHAPGGDDQVRAAIIKVAEIARDVRAHLEPGPVPLVMN